MSDSVKQYFSYNQIHRTITRLAGEVLASGYNPDLIVAIGTGGFIPARMLKTFLKKPILTVGVALYDDNNQPAASPRKIQWIDEVERKLTGKRILLVDEVDDSRLTLAFCLRELLSHQPAEIGVAVLHCKNKEKRDVLPPQVKRYWAGEYLADNWVVYPWDARDIDEHQACADLPVPPPLAARSLVGALSAQAAQPHPVQEEILAKVHDDRETCSDLRLDFGSDGMDLLPVVTQDANSGQVLILSWINRQALEETRRSGRATYWSRSRKCLWTKGDSSGDWLKMVDIRVNCEQNSLLYLVEPQGSGACHAFRPDGRHHATCFYRSLAHGDSLSLVDGV